MMKIIYKIFNFILGNYYVVTVQQGYAGIFVTTLYSGCLGHFAVNDKIMVLRNSWRIGRIEYLMMLNKKKKQLKLKNKKGDL